MRQIAGGHRLALIFLFSAMATAPAWALLEVRAFGLLNLTDPSYQDSSGSQQGAHMRGGLGAGALLGFKIFPPLLALESGLILAQRHYAFDQPQVTQKWSYLEIPLGVRLYLSDLNFTGGIFFSKGLGEVTEKDGQGQSSSATFVTKNLAASGMGVYLGAAYGFTDLFFVETRLMKDFKNHATDGKTLKFVNYQVLLGARLALF